MGHISQSAFTEALEVAQKDFEIDICETTLMALSDKDREFLSAMVSDAKESRVADIAERMNVTIDYLQKYRKRLIDSGVIEPAGRGYVRYAVPYIQEYLRKRLREQSEYQML